MGLQCGMKRWYGVLDGYQSRQNVTVNGEMRCCVEPENRIGTRDDGGSLKRCDWCIAWNAECLVRPPIRSLFPCSVFRVPFPLSFTLVLLL